MNGLDFPFRPLTVRGQTSRSLLRDTMHPVTYLSPVKLHSRWIINIGKIESGQMMNFRRNKGGAFSANAMTNDIGRADNHELQSARMPGFSET